MFRTGSVEGKTASQINKPLRQESTRPIARDTPPCQEVIAWKNVAKEKENTHLTVLLASDLTVGALEMIQTLVYFSLSLRASFLSSS